MTTGLMPKNTTQASRLDYYAAQVERHGARE